MLRPDFTLEDLLAELAQPGQPVAGYQTLTEWTERLGCSRSQMQTLLHAAKRRGLLRVTRDRRPAIDGCQRTVPVYALDLGT